MSRSRDWERANRRERSQRSPKPPTLPTAKPPTPKQQRYLRYLAAQTGTTFVPPRTSFHAGREIERLLKLPKKHRK